jgi:hypothetical protein
MDPRLLRISRSYRRSTRTRYQVALALEAHDGNGTIQQIADWTGLDVTRVTWALRGSDPKGFFRASASLLGDADAEVRIGRGGEIFALTELGHTSLEAARRDPTFAVPRAARAAAPGGFHAGTLQV